LSRRFRAFFSFIVVLVILALLTWRTIITPPSQDCLLPGVFFVLLVVEAYGGQIGLESKAGQGCTFVVRLPVQSTCRKMP
jgi:hypothetical protein